MKTPSRITVSYAEGEDLYVHPYSIAQDWSASRHRVRWLNPEEFQPYPSWMQDHLWDSSGNYGWRVWNRLRRWYWTWPVCWVVSAWAELRRDIRWYWRDRWWWKRPWRWLGWLDPCLFYPVLCRELYPGVLNLTGQLQVNDPGDLTETYYLTPTKEYINLRFEEASESYLRRACGEGVPLVDREQDRLFDLGSFLVWKHKQEALGREIHYLVSLDT